MVKLRFWLVVGIFVLVLPFVFGRNALEPSGGLSRYDLERSNIGFLNQDNNWTGNNTFFNFTFFNFTSYNVSGVVYASNFCYLNGSCINISISPGNLSWNETRANDLYRNNSYNATYDSFPTFLNNNISALNNTYVPFVGSNKDVDLGNHLLNSYNVSMLNLKSSLGESTWISYYANIQPGASAIWNITANTFFGSGLGLTGICYTNGSGCPTLSYYNSTYDSKINYTYNSSYHALIGTVTDNTTWNETRANSLYATFGNLLNNISDVNTSWKSNASDQLVMINNILSDFFNKSKDDTIFSNVIFSPSSNVTFGGGRVYFNVPVWFLQNITLTNLSVAKYNGSVLLTDIGGVVRVNISVDSTNNGNFWSNGVVNSSRFCFNDGSCVDTIYYLRSNPNGYLNNSYNATYDSKINYTSNISYVNKINETWKNISGNATFTTGNVGIGTTTPRTKLELGSDGSILALGTFDSGWTETNIGSTSSAELLWYPRKSAFRAGQASSLWDNDNIGNYSFATGYYTQASGTSSFATGYQTNASGEYSIAMGAYTKAELDYSTAIGYGSRANGELSFASGLYSNATGTYSTAIGSYTNSTGLYSTALGFGTVSQSYASTAIGIYNNFTGAVNIWQSTDPLFVVGNGIDENNRANAFTILKSGKVGINLTYPNFDISLQGITSKIIGIERNTNGEGQQLTITAGGSESGSLDNVGGNLTLQSGTSTGIATSNIIFKTSPEAIIGGMTDGTLTNAGTNYVIDNTLTLSGGDNNCNINVDSVGDPDGEILTYTIIDIGSGYSIGTTYTASGGSGTSASFTPTILSGSTDNTPQTRIVIKGNGNTYIDKNVEINGNTTANVYKRMIDWVYTIIGMSGNTACNNLDNKITNYTYTCQTCVDTAGSTISCSTTLVTLNANCACKVD